MDKKLAIQALAALAQDTRLDIFRHLAQTGPQPAGQIGERFGLAWATLSFHLSTLKRAGLLHCRREGRLLVYQADCGAVASLMAYLTEHCCMLPDGACAAPPSTANEDIVPMNQSARYNVLFLCTGNSARSILAEALLNHLGQGRFRAYSAGSHPTGQVNPFALQLLREQGLPTEGLRSKSWDEFAAPDAPAIDFVFTVCGNAAGETCPIWPGQPLKAHWGVDDPAAATGSDAQKMLAFRQAFRQLENRIRIFLELPIQSLEPSQLQARLREIGQIVLEQSA